jgi:hypothetical protein
LVFHDVLALVLRFSRGQNTQFSRGQTLLETLIVVSTVLIGIAIVTTALHAMATNARPQLPRFIALEIAQNAATELLAASAYDATALDRLAPAQWRVIAPYQPSAPSASAVSPTPSPPSANPASLVLTLTVQRSGRARHVNLHYKGSGVEGDLPVTVRSLAPPPGAIIDPVPSPSP